MNTNTTKIDIHDRTLQFARNCINFAKTIPQTVITRPLVNQFIKSSTSIGANCAEANTAQSRFDFIHKLGIAKKEALETKYWLVLLREIKGSTECEKLETEAREIHNILHSIITKTRENTNSTASH
jgi:four helix bundle protein